MKIRQPITEARAEVRRARREGLGAMNDEDIRAYVERRGIGVAALRNLLVEVLVQQRTILRCLDELKTGV